MPKIYEHSGTHLFLLQWRAYQAVIRYDQKCIRQLGFSSLSDFAVLEVLLHLGSLPVNELGGKILLTSGSTTTAVDRLEKKKWVKREKTELDRRVVMVHLTEAGRDLITVAFEQHTAKLNLLFDALDNKERSQFAKLSRKLGLYAEKITE